MVDKTEAYCVDLDKFENICKNMQTHFDLKCKGTVSLRKKISKMEAYMVFRAKICWDDELLLQLYFAFSQNCKSKGWNVVFWNIHNGVKPLEWLTEWNCYPALQLGSEKSASEIANKLYRESIYHKEDPEKYIDHSPLFSCWWTVVLSEDKSWGLYTDLDYNMYLFFNEKHLNVFNDHAKRLESLSDLEMIVFERAPILS